MTFSMSAYLHNIIIQVYNNVNYIMLPILNIQLHLNCSPFCFTVAIKGKKYKVQHVLKHTYITYLLKHNI